MFMTFRPIDNVKAYFTVFFISYSFFSLRRSLLIKDYTSRTTARQPQIIDRSKLGMI